MNEVVQLNFTPEIEVFYMLFYRYLSTFSMTSLKQNIEYFHSRCKIKLSLPVDWKVLRGPQGSFAQEVHSNSRG